MPRFITFLLLTALPAALVFSQGAVVVQNPVADLTQFQDVYVAEGGHGYAVGTCGIIATTTNNGMSWTTGQSPNAIDFTTVACLPGTNCQTILLANDNLLARSVNGGTTWSYSESENWNGTNLLHVLGNNIVIADKGFNSIRKSTDGGLTWTDIDLSENQRTPMEFTSATEGYYFANTTNSLIKTTDAGSTWNASGYSHSASVRYFTFLDQQTGFLFDQDNKVFKTTDGGQSWTDMNTTGLTSSTRVFTAISPTQVRAVSVTDRLWESDDSGTSWTSSELTSDDGIFVKQKYHRRGNEYWLVSNLSEILYSPADFTNWESGIPAERIDINAIVMTENGVGYAGDSRGGLLKTTNNGDDWDFITPNITFSRTNELALLPDGRILGLFSGLFPMVSSDGGLTWVDYLPTSAQDFLDNYRPNSFALLPSGRQYFIESERAVYSDDNGATWNLLSHPDNISINQLYFFDDNLGFGAGFGGGQMARTTDGGLNWENITANSPTSQPVNEFYFSDANNGIVFNGSTAYRTTDGGNSWTIDSQVPGGYDLITAPNGDLFMNEFGSGNNAEFWRSQDNGETWESIGYVCAPSRAATISPDGRYYFGAGDGGSIVRIDVNLISSVRVAKRDIQAVRVFPNPTSGLTNIELPDVSGAIQLEVFNVAGQSVYRMEVNNQVVATVDLSTHPAGIYTFRLAGEGWLQTGRVVLAK